MVGKHVWIEMLTVDGTTLGDCLRDIMADGNARRVVINDGEGTTLLRLPLSEGYNVVFDNPRLLLMLAWPLKDEPLTLIVERAEQRGPRAA